MTPFLRRLAALAWLLSAALSFPLWAVPAAGSFTATAACDAYVSKNQKTNPDGARLAAGTHYPVIEANTADAPSWYRLQIDGAAPPERWVEKRCGDAKVQIFANSAAACRTPGLADAYVLAVSWQAAFCSTHRAKPECAAATPPGWAASNFTLHGLWPNLSRCGTDYGFCTSQPQRKAFCDYPDVALSEGVRQSLGQVMPSAAAGSCLQRYEWYKHGTCQQAWNEEGYFAAAIALTRQFNESGIASYMAGRAGRTVAMQDFLGAVDRALGEGAHRRMKFTCQNGNLVDIYMNLPAAIPAQAKLADLLRLGKEGFSSNCGKSFRVDASGNRL